MGRITMTPDPLDPFSNGDPFAPRLGHRISKLRQIINGLAVTLLFLALNGCIALHWRGQDGSVQHSGALHYSIIDTDSARVFVTESFGLDLRLALNDPGLSLGYRKYISVQPKPNDIPRSEQDGYFWIKESTSDDGGLYLRKVIGTDLGFNTISNGLTIGYDRTTIVVGPPLNKSVTTKIDFSENDLKSTHYLLQPGGSR